MVGADGSNGKDGIFCGKEKMQMSVYYSIGSILLGLAAWWIPYAARGKVRNFGGLSKYVFLSFCCCVAALFLQFLEIRYRVQIRDFRRADGYHRGDCGCGGCADYGYLWHEWCGIFIRSGEI